MASLIRWGDDAVSCSPELLAELPSRANKGISDDFRKIVLRLRSDIYWSDGVALTANDIVFTAHEVAGPEGGALSADWRQFQSVRAPNDRTVVLLTRAPTANFVARYLCAGMLRWILPQHLLAGTPLAKASYNRMPIGAGPFLYSEVIPGTEIRLKANPRYFRGVPKLQTIIVKVMPDANSELVQMETHELDMLANLSGDSEPAARRLQNVRVKNLRTYGMLRILFNAASDVTNDAIIRRSLRAAIDRRKIAAAVFHGYGRSFEQLFIPEDPMHANLPYVEFNPTTARQMLEADGWRVSSGGVRQKNGRRLTIYLVAPSQDIGVDKTIELIRSNWADVGVELIVKRLPLSTLGALNGPMKLGHFDAAIILHGTASVSFENQWTCRNFPPRGFNEGRFCDLRVDALVASLNRTDDRSERRRLLNRFQQIIEDSAAVINIIQLPNVLVLSDRVHNTHDNAWSLFERFSNVDAW